MRDRSLLLILVLCLATPLAAGELDPAEIGYHAEFLNSAEIGPRGRGDPGLDTAARYLAVQLERYGLEGAGPDGSYFERSEYVEVRPGPGCLLAARRSESSRVLRPGSDFLPFPYSATGEREGGVSLLGPAGSPELGPDVAGRVILWAGSSLSDLESRARRAADAGALGILVAPDPRTETVDVVVFRDGHRERGRVVDRGREFDFSPVGEDTVRRLTVEEIDRILLRVPAGPPSMPAPWLAPSLEIPIPVMAISGAAAKAILGRPIDRMLEALETSGRDGPVAVEEVRVRLDVEFVRDRRAVRNVVGVLPGAPDSVGLPPLVLQTVYSGGEPEGRSTAAVLEAARVLAGLPRTHRSIEVRFLADGPSTSRFAVPPGAGRDEVAAMIDEIRKLAAEPESAEPGHLTDPGDPTERPVDAPAPPATAAAAREARLTGRLDRARAAIDGAIRAAPDDPELYLERGRILLAAGDPDGVRAEVETLRRMVPAPEDPEAEPDRKAGLADLLRSELLAAEGRKDEAMRALSRAADFGLAEAVVELARRRETWTAPEVMAQSMRELESVLPVVGESALGDCVRGILCIWSGRSLVAREFLSSAIVKDPLLALAYFYRASARLDEPYDLDGAVADCDRAIELGFQDPETWFNRGMAHLRARRYTLAIEDFKVRAAMEPGDANGANAVYNIACAYALAGDREAALEWLGIAMTRGFRAIGHARSDPDLEGIRSDPRFERILLSRQAE